LPHPYLHPLLTRASNCVPSPKAPPPPHLRSSWGFLYLLLFVFVSPPLLPADGQDPKRTPLPASFQNLQSEALLLSDTGDHAGARSLWIRALREPSLSPTERDLAHFHVAASHAAELDEPPTALWAQKVLDSPSAAKDLKARCHLLLGKMFASFGGQPAWYRVRESSTQALDLEDLQEGTRLQAYKLRSTACTHLRLFSEARSDFDFIAGNRAFSILDRAHAVCESARTLWLSRQFSECQPSLTLAEELLVQSHSDPEADALRAEIQLLRGLCSYDEGQDDSAKAELLKVLSLPGQTSASSQSREALLRLRLRKLIPDSPPSLKVLFIGSSHTIRGNLPLLLEQIAASAPSDRPKIQAGEKTRMGTGMRAHWQDGTDPDTARGRITAEPWDAVVVETFFRNNRQDLAYWSTLYLNLIRAHGAQMILYETPVARAIAYPTGFEEFHQNNLWLASQLQIPLAPSVDAWQTILGPAPADSDFKKLYADWIHATPRGAYLTACSLYPALTGKTAEGLFHPPEISPADALSYQRAGWASFQAARKTRTP
jgi:hypothetical protein